MSLSPSEEQKMMRDVTEMRDALLGSFDGKPGALHTLDKLCESHYQLKDRVEIKDDKRLLTLESEKQMRVGFIGACSFVAALIGFLINAVITWVANKK